MTLGNSISIRFDDATKTRLTRISEKTKLTPADLVRTATAEFLDRAENTGEIRIPLAVHDPRTPYVVKPRHKKP